MNEELLEKLMEDIREELEKLIIALKDWYEAMPSEVIKELQEKNHMYTMPDTIKLFKSVYKKDGLNNFIECPNCLCLIPKKDWMNNILNVSETYTLTCDECDMMFSLSYSQMIENNVL